MTDNTSRNLSLLCTYDLNNDQISIDLTRGINDLESDKKDLVITAAGLIIMGMNEVIEELISDENFGNIFKNINSFVVEFGYDYASNLKEARQRYGADGYRDELISIGKSIISLGVGAVSTDSGKAIGSLVLATPAGRVGGAIIGGVVSTLLYKNYLEDPVDQIIENLVTPSLQTRLNQPSQTPKVAISYETADSSVLKTETYDLVSQEGLHNFLNKYSLNDNFEDYSNSISSFVVNDGNGNNFNLIAFPDFSDLSGGARQVAQDQFAASFLNSAFLTFDYDAEQFVDFLNNSEIPLSSFISEAANSLQIGSGTFSSAFDSYLENSFLRNLGLDSNLFSATVNVTDGVLTTEGGVEFDPLNFELEEFDLSEDISREEIEVPFEEVFDFEEYLASQGYHNLEDISSDREEMQLQYERISNNLMQDLERQQADFLDGLNEDLQQFLEENPSDWQDQIDGFLADYDNSWRDMINNLTSYWQADVDSLTDEYQSIIYYDLDSLDYEYFVGNLHAGLDGDWDFDPELQGDSLVGRGYWEVREAFSVDDFSENGSEYWSDFDSNGDGVIEEDEFGGDFSDYFEWTINSGDGWLVGYDPYDEINWEDYWIYIDEEYDMQDYWDIDVGLSFDLFYPDYSEMFLENFISASSWSSDISSSWQPSDISFDVGFNANFNFEVDEIERDFENFLFNFRYQPALNLNLSMFDRFNEQSYQIINANSSEQIINGGAASEIINATSRSLQINSGAGFDIINGAAGNDVINAGADDDILIGNGGANILQGAQGDDIYIFTSSNHSSDQIIDDDGAIIIDQKILAGIAIQEEGSDIYKLGDYLLKKENGDLKISYQSNSILIKNFENKKFGIELDSNPQSANFAAQLSTNRTLFFNVLGRASDLDGDALSLYSITQAQNGVVEIDAASGLIKYRANENFSGNDSFQYLLGDGKGGFITETVEITVSSASEAVEVNLIVVGADNAAIISNGGSADLLFGNDEDNNVEYTADAQWNDSFVAWNPYLNEIVEVTGKNRSFDAFDAQGGDGDILKLTNSNDAFFLDDAFSANPNAGDERLAGVEVINARGGDDIIDLSSVNVTYGNVTIYGGAGSDVLWGNDGDDIIYGEADNDNIIGGSGGDVLDAGAGDDAIKVYTGNDIITGGLGSDILNGADGEDIFVFTSLADSTFNASDLISDFTKGEDRIDFSALHSEGIANDNSLSYHFENGVTIIENADRSFVVRLTGEIELNTADFSFG